MLEVMRDEGFVSPRALDEVIWTETISAAFAALP
jgi:hypothetical protein